MKHCKYSKTKDVKPFKVIATAYRYDGVSVSEYFCRNQESAIALIEFLKEFEPQPNEYYFRTTYEVKFLGNQKFI